jgi:hypothetical protein
MRQEAQLDGRIKEHKRAEDFCISVFKFTEEDLKYYTRVFK